MKRLLPMCALLVVCVGGTTVSSAATLRLNGGDLHSFTHSRCTDAKVTVEPIFARNSENKFDLIHVTGLPSNSCAGGELLVEVYEYKAGSGTTTVFGAGTGRIDGVTSLDLSSSSSVKATKVRAVLVTVDGWAIAALQFNPEP